MGRLMFYGPREEMAPWFTEGCGYPYDPKMHGLVSDWGMDLVNIGFKKPEVGLGYRLQGVRVHKVVGW
jgi:hypothetical protein